MSRTLTKDQAYSRRWYTLGVLCLSLLVIVVDTTIVNVALPTFARDLHASTSGLQWIVDAYTLTFAALLLPAGAIADRYGRQRALAAGLTVFAAGSLAAAFTHTTSELIAARAVMGIGGAFIMPATLSIITTVFTHHAERTKAIGLWSAVSGLGVAIGPVAGGWLSGRTAGLGALSVALLVLFAVWEARAKHPMLPLRLFRNPRFTGAGLSITVLFFALSGVVFLSSQIYQFVLGYSPLAAGVRALPSAAALAVFSPVGAALAKRAGVRVPVTLGLAAVTGGLLLFATASGSSGYGHYVLAMVIVSAGIGLAMSAATSASMRELPPAMAGVGSAVNDTTRNMGSVLGVAVFGSITASVFAGRMGSSAGSLGAAAAAGHQPGGASVLHAAASAFVTGADRAVLAGAIVVAAGLVVAFRAFRPVRAAAEVSVEARAEARVLEAARG